MFITDYTWVIVLPITIGIIELNGCYTGVISDRSTLNDNYKKYNLPQKISIIDYKCLK